MSLEQVKSTTITKGDTHPLPLLEVQEIYSAELMKLFEDLKGMEINKVKPCK